MNVGYCLINVPKMVATEPAVVVLVSDATNDTAAQSQTLCGSPARHGGTPWLRPLRQARPTHTLLACLHYEGLLPTLLGNKALRKRPS